MSSVSFIIVTHNSENEIDKCLDSLINLKDRNIFEIIIIDNASKDSTADIIQKYKNISLIQNKENHGYTKANNQGISIANGKYIFLLNPDTVVPSGTLAKLTAEIESDEKLGAIAPQLRFPNGKIQYSCRRFPRRRDVIYEIGLNKLFKYSKEFKRWKMLDFNHTEAKLVDQPAGAAILFPQKIVNEIGLLDEQFPMFFSDVDFCKRTWDAGYAIKFTPSVYITHKGGASIYQKQIRMIISSHLSFWKYFRKHYRGFVNQIQNSLIGFLLLLLIPIRLFTNLIFPNYHNKKQQYL